MQEVVEQERETQYLEVDSEVLSKYGWKLYPRTDGHVFTVLVEQGTDLEKAFFLGQGIYARHQLKDVSGVLRKNANKHLDCLAKERLKYKETMSTQYNPSIGHSSFLVLICT